MKFRIISDLHMDNCIYRDIIAPIDPDTVLILAGDIASYYGTAGANKFFEDVSKTYRMVFYVPGNHEYYGGKITHECPFDLPDNVKLLDNDTYQLDGYNFIGSTLWVSFNNNPLVEILCKTSIKDFINIYNTNSNGCISIAYVKRLHAIATQFIIDSHVENMTNIVITHYPPSYQSCDLRFRTNADNPGYMNDMDSIVISLAPALWVHGHTHASADYMIDSTRVVCNPRGYSGVRNIGLLDQFMKYPTINMYDKVFRHENKAFDPMLKVEI